MSSSLEVCVLSCLTFGTEIPCILEFDVALFVCVMFEEQLVLLHLYITMPRIYIFCIVQIIVGGLLWLWEPDAGGIAQGQNYMTSHIKDRILWPLYHMPE